MTRQKTTAWVAGTAGIALLILVASWFLVLGPQRATAADLMTEKNAAELQNQQLALQNAALKAQLENLPARRARLAEIRATMPDDSELPTLLRQLQGSADSSGITLSDFTAAAPALWDTTAGAAASPAVVDVAVTLTTSGSFAETELYLKQLQADSTRFFLVESVSLSSGDSSAVTGVGTVSATISGKVFALTDHADAVAAAGSTAAAPTAAPTAAAPATAVRAAATSSQPTATPTAIP